jgi:hypothetical protein
VPLSIRWAPPVFSLDFDIFFSFFHISLHFCFPFSVQFVIFTLQGLYQWFDHLSQQNRSIPSPFFSAGAQIPLLPI